MILLQSKESFLPRFCIPLIVADNLPGGTGKVSPKHVHEGSVKNKLSLSSVRCQAVSESMMTKFIETDIRHNALVS